MRPAPDVDETARELRAQTADAPPLRVVRQATGVEFGRPPARVLRWLKAYTVTVVVLASYLSARFQTRFRSQAAMKRILAAKHLRNARRIERAIVQLQGLFIKIGQLISIMTNFLPEEFRKQLEGLQDHVPPRPYEDIRERLVDELAGRDPDDVFAEFDRCPVASASIGQVHVARLKSGEKVAVKVQYPDIETIVRSDLRVMRRIITLIRWLLPSENLDQIYREIRSMILEELDFRREADNIQRVAANFDGRRDVEFPRVVASLSTSRLLVTHWEDGVRIGDFDALDRAGFNRAEVARLVVELYCQQIFTDCVYHADPHPGNVLVRWGGDDAAQVVFLDFGAVAEVSPRMRDGIVELIQGGLSRDTERIVRAMRNMGFVARGADHRVFERVVEYFHDQFQEQIKLDSFNLKDIKFDPEKSLDNLADLRRMNISLRQLSSQFHVPKEWILLERTLLLLMGLCTALDPAMSPMTVIRPYLERFVLGDEGDWSTLVVNTTKDLALTAVALPGEMRRFMLDARRGELSVQFTNLERQTQLLYRLGHQAMLVGVGMTCAAMAVVFEGRDDLARALWAWRGAKACAVLFAWSWWTTRARMRRR
jgi:predicted unusual protein kinase regulating ubiquinone biosynthesis (AarF/ABC1/UbiB family)